MTKRDPMEQMILDALTEGGFCFADEYGTTGLRTPSRLDFYPMNYGVYIEVKQFHSDRIAAQMTGERNVIVAQGREAVAFLAALLKRGDGYEQVNKED